MSDRNRPHHRHTPAPHGHLPNWVVAVFAAGMGTLAVLLHHVV